MVDRTLDPDWGDFGYKDAGPSILVVVELEPGVDLPYAVMDLLKIQSAAGTQHKYMIPMPARPSDEVIAALRALPGVKTVHVS